MFIFIAFFLAYSQLLIPFSRVWVWERQEVEKRAREVVETFTSDEDFLRLIRRLIVPKRSRNAQQRQLMFPNKISNSQIARILMKFFV